MCKRPGDTPCVPKQRPLLQRLIATIETCAASVAQEKSVSNEHDPAPPQSNVTVTQTVAEGMAADTAEGNEDALATMKAGNSNKQRHQSHCDDEMQDDGSFFYPDEPTSISKRSKKRRRRSSCSSNSNIVTEKGNQRSTVMHDYHDYSSYLAAEKESAVIRDAAEDKKTRGGISSAFPAILHQMLEHAVDEGFSDVISWQTHGRSFHVHDQDRFVKEVMPRYFRQTRFSSFQRQLSLYGFLRLTRRGEDHGAYYHELCLRGMPHLCAKIQRTRVKGYWVRQSSSPETEPDFYNMPPAGVPEPAPIVQSEKSSQVPMPPLSASTPMNTESIVLNNITKQANIQTGGCGPLSGSNFTNLAYRPESGISKMGPPGDAFYSFGQDLVGSLKGSFAFNKYTNRAHSPETVGLKSSFLELPPEEQADLAAFLSDVDLESDHDDNDVYRNETELERIYAMKQAHNTMSV